MKCQACDKPATHHVTELVANQPVEFHVCEAHLQDLESLGPYARPTKPDAGFASFVDAPELRAALRDPGVRKKMAAHLLPALCLALLDEQPEVRVAAAFRLMLLGPDARSACGALRDALSSPDERVRKAAQIALECIQTEQEAPWFC